jgi:hypothetical protein
MDDFKKLSFVFKCRFVICKYCFMCSVWNVFCFCAHYTFLMYRPESVLFLYTVHISDVPSGKCSVPVHSTHF